MVTSIQSQAFSFFRGENCEAFSTLPFPSQEGGENGILVAHGANLSTAQRLHGSESHFVRESVDSIAISHYFSGGERGVHDGGILMEFEHHGGKVTSVCTAGNLEPQRDLNSCIISGSSNGMLNAISVTVPQRSTSKVEDIVVRGGVNLDEGCTLGTQVHKGAVRAIRWISVTNDLVTAGMDGKLTCHKLDSQLASVSLDRYSVLAEPSPWRSFIDVSWLGPNALVTIGTGGIVQVWDARVTKGAVSQSRSEWVSGARFNGGKCTSEMRNSLLSLHSVASVPSLPRTCIVGHRARGGRAGGMLSCWDLRMMREPEIVILSENSTGSVVARPDPKRTGEATASFIAATTEGQLFEVDIGQGSGVVVNPLCDIDGGWIDVEADQTNGAVVMGCTDQQGFVFVPR